MAARDGRVSPRPSGPRIALAALPFVAVAAVSVAAPASLEGFDIVLDGDAGEWASALLDEVAEVAARRYTPQLFAQGAVDFQLTRGLLAVSV